MTRSGYVIATYAGLSLLALLISAGRGDVDVFRFDHQGSVLRMLLWHPLLGLGVGFGIVGLSRLATRHFAWAQQLHRDFRTVLGEQNTREIVILASASSIGEELLFRGALMPWLGIWPQAILFALLHIGPSRRFLSWTFMALIVGAGFGYLAMYTGNLAAPIAAHFCINACNLRFIVNNKMETDNGR